MAMRSTRKSVQRFEFRVDTRFVQRKKAAHERKGDFHFFILETADRRITWDSTISHSSAHVRREDMKGARAQRETLMCTSRNRLFSMDAPCAPAAIYYPACSSHPFALIQVEPKTSMITCLPVFVDSRVSLYDASQPFPPNLRSPFPAITGEKPNGIEQLKQLKQQSLLTVCRPSGPAHDAYIQY